MHNLHRVLLHRKIPGSCISTCLGSEIDVNLAFANIEVRFGGCFNAKIGLVSINFFFAHNQLYAYLENNNLLSDCQFGYRRKSSTENLFVAVLVYRSPGMKKYSFKPREESNKY